ncbi:MAG: calcium/sodium antiporter [Pseudomonadota bacterium]
MSPIVFQDVSLAILGLVVLLVAGDLLVRGSVALAGALNIPKLIVGLTIVAFGTSAPELMVSIKATLTGDAGIAIGNIVGSNIANVLLVLGVPAIIYPVASKEPGCRRYASAMLGATALFAFYAYAQGAIGMTSGVVLFGGLLLYLAYAAVRAMSGDEDPMATDIEEFEANGSALKIAAFLILGLVGLPLGANLLVENGAEIARELNVREEVIGLTLIAFGTSLPELATTVSGAIRREQGIVIGNILGSNIFNLLAVGAAIGVFGGARFDEYALTLDIPVMIAAALIIAVVVYTRATISRGLGLLFLGGYLAYIFVLTRTAGV